MLQAAAVRALGSHRDDRVASSLLAAGRFATYPPSLRDEVLSALFAQSYHLPGLLAGARGRPRPDRRDRRPPPPAAHAAPRRRHSPPCREALRDRPGRPGPGLRGVQGRRRLEGGPGPAAARSSGASAPRATGWTRKVTPSAPTSSASATSPSRRSCSTSSCPTTRSRQGSRPIPSRPRTAACSRASSRRRRPPASRSASRSARRTPSSAPTSTRSPPRRQSLMPQGLEKTISRQEFADLLAYLKGEGNPSREHGP